jgi:hypothetical protein
LLTAPRIGSNPLSFRPRRRTSARITAVNHKQFLYITHRRILTDGKKDCRQQDGLLFRQDSHRRQRAQQTPAGRQRGQPGRNDQHRPSSSPWIYHYHRMLRRLLQERAPVSGGADGRGSPAHRDLGERAGQEVRGREESLVAFGPFGCRGFDAGDDEHDPESGPDGRDGREPGRGNGQPAFRLRCLPPLDQHVRRRGDGSGSRALRARV